MPYTKIGRVTQFKNYPTEIYRIWYCSHCLRKNQTESMLAWLMTTISNCAAENYWLLLKYRFPQKNNAICALPNRFSDDLWLINWHNAHIRAQFRPATAPTNWQAPPSAIWAGARWHGQWFGFEYGAQYRAGWFLLRGVRAWGNP